MTSAIALQEQNATHWNNRCWYRTGAGLLREAVADCNEALRLIPTLPHALDSRGAAHLKLGQLDNAIADYDAALRLAPRNASSLFGRGVARRLKGDAAGAEADIAAARSLDKSIDARMAHYGIK